ncbi:aquaporin 3 (Gill blood group) [Homo sapiens]|uniref:Aquaporin 3 (Gill blood group) n=1 Tax=Homo sapiens TaxID=9606 RepID=A0A2R8YD22_HUMAN|nr:aquaporin 3 (Gill blood group) [Homo sapiens]KAI4006941.1 aquaporin 3 (Gill blood group) [Homo sapiens]
MGRQKELVSRCGEMLHIRYRLLRQALAECLGTLILVMFGCGSVAQVVLSRGTHGGFLTINLAFGFAVTLGILIAGQVSGPLSPLPRGPPEPCRDLCHVLPGS